MAIIRPQTNRSRYSPRPPKSAAAACMAAIGLLLVAACGGGGDSSSSSGTPAVQGVTTPTIVTAPQSASATPGSGVTFSVTADGNGLAYQWQRSTNGGLSWTPIDGATQSAYTIGPVDASANGYQYRVIVQNAAGVVVSPAATLTVSGSAPGTGSPPTLVIEATQDSANRLVAFVVDETRTTMIKLAASANLRAGLERILVNEPASVSRSIDCAAAGASGAYSYEYTATSTERSVSLAYQGCAPADLSGTASTGFTGTGRSAAEASPLIGPYIYAFDTTYRIGGFSGSMVTTTNCINNASTSRVCTHMIDGRLLNATTIVLVSGTAARVALGARFRSQAPLSAVV